MNSVGELYDEFQDTKRVGEPKHYRFTTDTTIKGEPVPDINLDEPYPFLKIVLINRARHNL